MVGVSFTYISKVENEKLDFGDYPSEELIRKLAEALETGVDELLILAKNIPEQIRQRVIERSDAFRKFARLDDETLDKLLKELEDESQSTGCNNFRNEAGSDRNILLEPPRVLSLEAALDYIEENARVEVTPSQIRLRKVLLQEVQPYRAARRRA